MDTRRKQIQLKNIIMIMLFTIILIGVVSQSHAESVALSWDPVSHPYLQGYYLFYGTVSGSYTHQVNVGNTTTYELAGLTKGVTYYVVTQAYDTDNNTSPFSNEVLYTVPGPITDEEPPTITITYPTSSTEYATGSGVISLRGTAADNINVTLVTWANNRGGSGDGTGTASWQIGSVALSEGLNVITLTAYDAAGNHTSDTLSVTYSPSVVPQSTNIDSLLWEERTLGYNVPDADQADTQIVDLYFDGVSGKLLLSFEAYDVDDGEEVQILLNGQFVAFAPTTANDQWGEKVSLLLPADFTNVDVENSVTFANRDASETWGVRNIAVTEVYQLPSQSSFGYGCNADFEKVASVSFIFDGRPGDVAISFAAYDVDYADEVEIFINGKSTDLALTTSNNTWEAGDTIILSDSDVNDSTFNVLTFVNRYNPDNYESWGVKDVSIVTSQTGTAKLLWSRTDGLGGLWTLDESGNHVTGSDKLWGPFTGWTARSYQKLSDGTARILWSHTSGRGGLWTLDANGDRIPSGDRNWGPYAGWTATSYQKLSDGTAKLLWSHTSGLAGVWTLDANDKRIPSGDRIWGPYTGWTATSYQKLSDGTARLLWSHTSGLAGLWTLDANDKRIPSGDKSWGPYKGWSALSYYVE